MAGVAPWRRRMLYEIDLVAQSKLTYHRHPLSVWGSADIQLNGGGRTYIPQPASRLC